MADYTNGEAPMLITAIDQAKEELRKEFDQDIMTLGAAIFGTTNSAGQVLKPGMVHMFNALDNTIAYLCEKGGVTPDTITNWLKEKAAQASTQPATKVTLD